MFGESSLVIDVRWTKWLNLVRSPNAMLVMYTSYANHLGSPSGPATAYRAVPHTAEVLPGDGGAGRCAVEGSLERHPVLGAHQVV